MPQVLALHDPLLPLVTRVLDLGLYAMNLGPWCCLRAGDNQSGPPGGVLGSKLTQNRVKKGVGS
jgi:hypothetical protein